jgi:hypothetical protein
MESIKGRLGKLERRHSLMNLGGNVLVKIKVREPLRSVRIDEDVLAIVIDHPAPKGIVERRDLLSDYEALL